MRAWHLIIAQLNPSLQTTTRYSGLFHLNDKSLSYLKYLYTSGNTLDNISAEHLTIVKHFIQKYSPTPYLARKTDFCQGGEI